MKNDRSNLLTYWGNPRCIGNFSRTVALFLILPIGNTASHADDANAEPASLPVMRAFEDSASGQILITSADQPVLRYNYRTIEPTEEFLQQIHPDNRKYASARSNYIHPLYGPDGEILTEDFSPDHPHHRGIYWAWPEVDFGDQRGDLHALQRVFARPTGNITLQSGSEVAEIKAENLWKWDDKTPIVRELASIRASRAGKHGWYVDLRFEFTALVDDVTIARRGTSLYGGLNARLSPVEELQLLHHADPVDNKPRRAWSDSLGIRTGGNQMVGFAVYEKDSNPHYPGDWIVFEKLPWFQPTFPAKNTRFALSKSEPLVLEYRLWVRPGGRATTDQYVEEWESYQALSP
jgi:hypothetical protein